MGNLIHVTDSTFDNEVIKSDKLTIVDFWAEWCGPCKMLAPILEEIANELSTKIKIVKFDVDESQEVPSSLGITSIPTLIFYKDGKIIEKLVGARPKDAIIKVIDSFVK